ncbi:hypothetical protein M3182_02370 [Mesobacillus maritimus]|uniref:hypothetical protein n=1 Tax=Mesobacillus maritimus TaxID=1643336 RepID=UPI00203A4B8E|nr:hypothetical protein [Mesobacillus maritimus]MCM3584587.1 hypothetical protein [Mesobacillus maritimus]MCM3670662.1 hypothetical protein [Mesobacillus maritimus]
MKRSETIVLKELLRCELIENYHVTYQEIEHQEFVLNADGIVRENFSVEKTVTIYRVEGYSTLQKINSYPAENLTMVDLLNILLREYPELFKKAMTKKAV